MPSKYGDNKITHLTTTFYVSVSFYLETYFPGNFQKSDNWNLMSLHIDLVPLITINQNKPYISQDENKCQIYFVEQIVVLIYGQVF